jgi:hypothetical protein
MTFRNGYSAKVALTLKVGGRDLPLSHVGPDEVSVRELCDESPPSDAQLIIQVDDSSDIMNVYLPRGISRDSHEIAYESAN